MPAHGFSRARQSDLAPDPRGHPNPIQYEFNTNSIRIQSDRTHQLPSVIVADISLNDAPLLGPGDDPTARTPLAQIVRTLSPLIKQAR